ncbi:hypothetical protein MMC25_004915 [Agyrium rufum]|nr:hypothetical protein [Agyrium rufum]
MPVESDSHIESLEILNNTHQPDVSLDGLAFSMPEYYDPQIMTLCLKQMKKFVGYFVHERSTPFIHPSLTAGYLSSPLLIAYSACAVYESKNEDNEHIVFQHIESQNKKLLAPTEPWDYKLNLENVQALLLLQLICLLDGDVRQRSLAEDLEPILDVWTQQLQARSESEIPSNLTAEKRWAFIESARRTILLSYLLRAVYATVSRRYYHLAPTLKNLSFTPARSTWGSPAAIDGSSLLEESPEGLPIPYFVFADKCKAGETVELDAFGTVLLTACQGALEPSGASTRDSVA